MEITCLCDDLNSILDSSPEWLIIGEDGGTYSIEREEIDIYDHRGKTFFGTVRPGGYATKRIEAASEDNGELSISLSSSFGRIKENLRLVRRVSAKELSANIEISRLALANEIAAAIIRFDPGLKLVRTSLNKPGGRLAQILAERNGKTVAFIADVTETLSAESLLSNSILWFERLSNKKKNPATAIYLIAQKERAAELLRLRSLLRTSVSHSLTILEIANNKTDVELMEPVESKADTYWKDEGRKISVPSLAGPSETACLISDAFPEKVDVVSSRISQTLRFNGLPFLRIRKLFGQERQWFGIGNKRELLDPETYPELERTLERLDNYRTPLSPSKRHELYRLSPEAWLESMLRRNIQTLDPNLILAPVFDQFNASNNKIDLLALRTDGRLVVIEIKTNSDRDTVFQAAGYWREVELMRRQGEFVRSKLFGELHISNKPAIVYIVAPALSFHKDFEKFACMLSPEIELWRFELHEDWRREIKVIGRRNYSAYA